MYVYKVNKCRTLGKFDQSLVPQTQTEDSSANTHEPKDLNAQKGQDKTDTKDHSGEDASKKKENVSETKQEGAQQGGEDKQKTESANQLQYLLFGPDEFIITTFAYETGWWYGYKDSQSKNPADYKFGFFPSNFVQVIEKYDNEAVLIPVEGSSALGAQTQQETTQQEEPITMASLEPDSKNLNWLDYANTALVNDEDLVIQTRLDRVEKESKTMGKNPDSIVGYKKIKIHESRSHSVNSSKEGAVQTSHVAIKDQSQVAKAYRLMNHYFDYDSWVEQMNQAPPRKAKGDPTKKKPKKTTIDW